LKNSSKKLCERQDRRTTRRRRNNLKSEFPNLIFQITNLISEICILNSQIPNLNSQISNSFGFYASLSQKPLVFLIIRANMAFVRPTRRAAHSAQWVGGKKSLLAVY
jgi:hypothetical protein